MLKGGENIEGKINDAVCMTNAAKLPVTILFTAEFTE